MMAIAAPIVACMVSPTLIELITKSHFICHESFLIEIGVVPKAVSTIFPSETVCSNTFEAFMSTFCFQVVVVGPYHRDFMPHY